MPTCHLQRCEIQSSPGAVQAQLRMLPCLKRLALWSTCQAHPALVTGVLQSLPSTLQSLTYRYSSGWGGPWLPQQLVKARKPVHMRLVEWRGPKFPFTEYVPITDDTPCINSPSACAVFDGLQSDGRSLMQCRVTFRLVAESAMTDDDRLAAASVEEHTCQSSQQLRTGATPHVTPAQCPSFKS